jgi:hypothetical protein
MNEYSEVKKTLVKSVVIVIIGILAPVLSLFLPWRPEGEMLATWFQRSGSIMVFFAVWAELKLLAIHSKMYPSGWLTETASALSKQYRANYNVVSGVVAFLAAAGTLIWGYGDLFVGNT